MKNGIPKILVLGATGQVGAGVIPLLATDPGVQAVAAARSPGKAQYLGVPVRHLNFDRVETIAPTLVSIERVFVVTCW